MFNKFNYLDLVMQNNDEIKKETVEYTYVAEVKKSILIFLDINGT